MNKQDFKEAVFEARKRSKNVKGFDLYCNVMVHIGEAVFELNPYRINLTKMIYEGREINLFTGRRMNVDLKKFASQGKGEENG